LQGYTFSNACTTIRNGLVAQNGIFAVANQCYLSCGSYGINMNNSDIINVNSLYFNDTSGSDEGVFFPRSNNNYDMINMNDGYLYGYINVGLKNGTPLWCISPAGCFSGKAQYAEKLNFYSDSVNIGKSILCCGVGSSTMFYLWVVNCTNNNLFGVFTDYGEKNIKILSPGEGVCLYCNNICSYVVNAKNNTHYIKFG
jgi:hypothetical protein